jgi:hypothetical protein
MTDRSADSTDDEPNDQDVPEEAQEDPGRIDKEERYEDRHEEARDVQNVDDHRDEEPHQS